ncbi:hypothetical protein HXX76_009740 [Chlamydomonas incerta]|uniref:Protein kinase domain-containing protein n=1 Tax=Chlamydomonas incerta TaxID=51695 RepID=A0A835SQ14_CHLIN|nr:hypothetical protein HXX76_009740 [Chlamydomonas incerta]|eukprot:KAG2431212.1 hypothetical protein HXX76_009740 [Chlamydomonas incerta]
MVLKHSPTLLFDILSEPDKDKLNAKLKGATVAGSPAPASTGQRSQRDLKQAGAQQDQEQEKQKEGAAAAEVGVIVSTATSATASGSAGAWGSSAEGTTGGSDGTEPAQRSAAAAAGDAAGDGGEAARRQAGGAVVPAASGAEAAGGAAADPLAEFTPRVILQELLGELFIAPERLTAQGTFGAGAFATVQSCSLDPPDGCGGPRLLVAVKSLKPEVLEDMEDLRRFLLEANLVRKLHHPNIVSIHGLGAHTLSSLSSLRASAYVVMEACEGGDLKMMVLRQMTGRSPAYSRLDALRWLTHIAAACSYLHETCRPMVIHRDLKLENVLLTGGPVDGRVAKITDFGLHKRAMHSRTEDTLIAVTNEWSTRGGSVYRTGDGAAGGAAAAHGSGHGGAAAYGKPGGTAALTKDPSFYGGRSYYAGGGADASYYGGANGSGHAYGGGSMHRGGAGGGSTSARYVALASAGVAAVAAERSVRQGSMHGGTAGAAASAAALTSPPDPFLAAGGAALAAISAGGGAGADISAHSHGTSAPGGGSLRAGSEAAEALGLAAIAMGGGNSSGHGGAASGPVGEREKPYLLALDKGRYDSPLPTSKFNSTNDLVAMHEAAAAAAAAAARTVSAAAASAAAAAAPPPPSRSATLPPLAGWAPPHVVPPASHEESVHRKMLALMALESAAAAAAPDGGGAAAAGAAGGGGGAAANETFSVTEFVRAATMTLQAEAAAAAATSNEGGGGGDADGEAGAAAAAALAPSPLTLMRSMTLALQQQKEAEQLAPATAAGAASLSPNSSLQSPSALPPLGALTAAPSRAIRGSVATGGGGMKTVPEENRMSMDLGPRPHGLTGARSSRGGGGGTSDGSSGGAGAGSASGSDRSVRGGSAPPPAASAGRRMSAAASKREKIAAAAAKMADATQQVGSLIYMAPELVTSGSYNEKVDVFSFAVIAYELFNGKLLAMKVANDAAYADMAAGGGGSAPATPPGAAAATATRSAEQAAQDGVMAYVLKRSGGARESLPGWWPPELKHLVSSCWAQDPAQRPPFSKIFRELRKMAADGTLAEMDARDPLRGGGCGCSIS